VVADYAEADATKIAVGQPATVTLSALPNTEVTGLVTAVSPTSTVVSNVVEYPVTIALENTPSDVKEGMTAEVAVIVQTASDVLQLPSAAITTTGTTSTVKVLSNGVQKTTPVTLGLVGTSYTEITSGVTEGQKVVEPTASVSASTSSGTSSPFGGGGGGLGGGGFGGGAP
jgi:multidrug efflux pump subunit AcrA (membrane-fusion protein)